MASSFVIQERMLHLLLHSSATPGEPVVQACLEMPQSGLDWHVLQVYIDAICDRHAYCSTALVRTT